MEKNYAQKQNLLALPRSKKLYSVPKNLSANAKPKLVVKPRKK